MNCCPDCGNSSIGICNCLQKDKRCKKCKMSWHDCPITKKRIISHNFGHIECSDCKNQDKNQDKNQQKQQKILCCPKCISTLINRNTASKYTCLDCSYVWDTNDVITPYVAIIDESEW